MKEHTLDGVGTWVVGANGTITFTPAKGYTGTASIDYTVTDSGDNVYEASLAVAVKGSSDVADEQAQDDDQPSRDDDGFLPDTGGPQALLVWTALGLMLTGGALVLLARRRTRY